MMKLKIVVLRATQNEWNSKILKSRITLNIYLVSYIPKAICTHDTERETRWHSCSWCFPTLWINIYTRQITNIICNASCVHIVREMCLRLVRGTLSWQLLVFCNNSTFNVSLFVECSIQSNPLKLFFDLTSTISSIQSSWSVLYFIHLLLVILFILLSQ